MKTLSHVLHIRQKRLLRQTRSPFGRVGLALSAVAGVFLLLLISAAVAVYTGVTRDLPSLQAVPEMLDASTGSLLQPTRLYDRTGTHIILSLEDPGASGHEYLTLEYLPQVLVAGYLAVFEPDFWESPGYTTQGLWDVEQEPLASRSIAQRLVSDLLLWEEAPSVRRNLRERILAAQLVARYGHAQVLEWSLNAAQFGPLVYGADAAARAFFGKTAVEINLAEAAFLIAAAQTPNTNPLEVTRVVIERQKTVLHSMLLQGVVNATEAALATRVELAFHDPIPATDPAPAFTNLVQEQLSAYYPLERIRRGGLRVITTLDYDLQIQALCTTATFMGRLNGQQEIEIAIDGQPCEAARLLPTLRLPTPGVTDGLAANAVILEPSTGQILAMVGELSPGLDPAHLPGHPAGSLLTPFIYLTQFTRGLGPASLLWDLPPAQLEDQADQAAQNLETYHGPVRLRTALANDYLETARQIIRELGSETILRMAHELGLESLTSLPAGGEAALDQPVLLLEAAHTYTIFANLGTLAGQPQTSLENSPPRNTQPALEPAAVLSLEDLHGRRWLDSSTPQEHAILAPQLAYLMTDALSDETARWPSLGHPNPLEIGRPAGAKLGLSSDAASAWSIGFTPFRLAAVWLGYNQDSGADLTPEVPAALWHALMQYASRELPPQDWEMPAGVSRVAVCDPSGLLPTENCPNIVNEIFLSGSEPVHQDNLYKTFQVNIETGQLATVFTPLEMVEERTFLSLPAEAVEWARQTGVPIPPDSYDVIYVSPSLSTQDVQISSPLMFGHISGNVQILGTAAGDDFAYYRLQAGQGLNPRSWLTISENVSTPVEGGFLGEWQTSDLSGLYILQLQVVRQDQSVGKSILQVTIDNTPPQLTLLSPASGQQIKMTSGLKVLLQAQASDDLELARLEFYIDEKLVATLSEAPFNLLWQGQSGKHTLLVKAYDLAGNLTQASADFELVR